MKKTNKRFNDYKVALGKIEQDVTEKYPDIAQKYSRNKLPYGHQLPAHVILLIIEFLRFK